MTRISLCATLAVSGSAADQCCWSKWGDDKSCGGYTVGGSGGLCSADWTKACSGLADCSASAAPAGSPAAAQQSTQSIELPFTIRDFKYDHPDFEQHMTWEYEPNWGPPGPIVGGHKTGIVENRLGDDGKPVFKDRGGDNVESKDTFNQWYNDVEGVNKKYKENMKLSYVQGTDNTYSYCSAAFFPLDDKTDAWPRHKREDTFKHKFWFTTEFHGSFVYTGKEVFKFSGDDDFWVFIDGDLVIDLGGLHPKMDKTIKLDKNIKLTNGALEADYEYDIEIFHAERHTEASNFCMELSINLYNDECGCGWFDYETVKGMALDFKADLNVDVEFDRFAKSKKVKKKANVIEGRFALEIDVAVGLNFDISAMKKDKVVLNTFWTYLCSLFKAATGFLKSKFDCAWINVEAKEPKSSRRLTNTSRRLAAPEKVDIAYAISVPSDSGTTPDKVTQTLKTATPKKVTQALDTAKPFTSKYGKVKVKASTTPTVSAAMEVDMRESDGANKEVNADFATRNGVLVAFLLLFICHYEGLVL